MNLPNHFFADAPHAPLTPELLAESCRQLRRQREKYLAAQPVEKIIALLCEVASEWLQPENKHRKLALAAGPAETGFSRATIERGLDRLFAQFTPENFRALLAQEFGDAARLDGFASANGKSSMVVAPELLVHVCAGNLPNPALMSITLGLLLRSAQFVKCASGASLLPRLFAHSLAEADPQLVRCLEIAEWRGGETALEEFLFAEADCVTATGGDAALAAIRAKVPASKRFIGHGHRVSFAFVGADVLSAGVTQIVARAADDVTAWDQHGCLSPHVIYIEDKGLIAADKFASLLAEELARRETVQPRGEISVAEAAVISSRREIYEIRAAHSESGILPDEQAGSLPQHTKLWRSENSTAWTVVFEADALFQTSCLNRFIYVKPVNDLTGALQAADAVRGKVSTVALAASEPKLPKLATELARWGATRICPLGEMQNPPLTWRHDGRPTLGDLVTWIDFET